MIILVLKSAPRTSLLVSFQLPLLSWNKIISLLCCKWLKAAQLFLKIPAEQVYTKMGDLESKQ